MPAANEVTRAPALARTADGFALRGEHLVPRSPQSVAVLGHAMMVDRRTMDRPRGEGLASTLASHGLAVVSFDLRGHGESTPTVREGARFSYDAIVRHDVPAMIAAARALHPGLRVTLVGHSLTGHAGLIAAGLDPARAPDAIVGIAPNLWVPRFEPSARRRVAKGALMLGWAAVSAPLGRFESRAFRMGSAAEPWPYVRELVRFYLQNRIVSEDGADDYEAALARARLPVLAISSEGDRLLANPTSVARFCGAMWRAELTHRVVTRADVAPPPDHMGLVTEPRSRPIWSEIARWILARA